MSDFIINNKCVLNGEITVSGSKNAALPILAASILGCGKSVLKNIPSLSDISIMTDILCSLGASVGIDDGVVIDTKNINKHSSSPELCTRIRASFLIAGPLLARFGRAEVPLPGGCRIGSRPVDLHLKGFKALGADYIIEDGYVKLSC
ncbi:MAG: UDP-N-acetylglucosamine 1-carboxyvinyltransferase, partial [Clostridia bacterium]|nr:UDP-N-acetylglucosamine 1-carboxyvinyltransferase [Clostridia bacterium]